MSSVSKASNLAQAVVPTKEQCIFEAGKVLASALADLVLSPARDGEVAA